jgi:hypothetical protein
VCVACVSAATTNRRASLCPAGRGRTTTDIRRYQGFTDGLAPGQPQAVSEPRAEQAIGADTPGAAVYVLRTPALVRRFLAGAGPAVGEDR